MEVSVLEHESRYNSKSALCDSQLEEMLSDAPLGIRLGFERFGEHREVFFFTTDRLRHQLVEGPSGCGKTNELVHQVVQDINTGTQVFVFDPGNAVDQIVAAVDEERLEDLVLADFSDPECKININFLDIDISDKTAVSRACEDAIEVLRGNIPFSWSGVRFEQKVRTAVMTILDKDFPHPRTPLIVGKLLLDKQFRDQTLQSIKSTYVLNSWKLEDEASRSSDYGETNQWVYAKFDIFDTNTTLKQAFGSGKPTIDIEGIMASGKSLLVKLDESMVGAKVADMLIRYFTMTLKHAVMRRSLIPEEERRLCILYFDEFQRFANESFSELLSEARKYRVGLVLANQNLRQLVPFSRQTEAFNSDLLESVLANVGTMMVFKPSAKDAAILADEFDTKPEKLRKVPPYCATVRLLSDGRAMEPVVMKISKPLGMKHPKNMQQLKERMKEEGMWQAEGKADKKSTAGKDEKICKYCGGTGGITRYKGQPYEKEIRCPYC
jgi:hypothetical protein